MANSAPTIFSAADGTVFTQSGAGGKVNGQSVVIQPDRKIVVAGNVDFSEGFAVARYNPDGSLDASFGSGGSVVRPTSAVRIFGVALQSDGKVVLAGSINTNANADIVAVRLNKDGSTDRSFGSDGVTVIPVGLGRDYGGEVAVQADGKIVISGGSRSNSDEGDFALVRLTANGQLDSSFGNGGKVTTQVSPTTNAYDYTLGLFVQGNGKIVVAGYSLVGQDDDFSVARYNANGTLDSTFSGDGKLTRHFGVTGCNDYGQDVVVQADGKTVVAGSSNRNGTYDFALARFNLDGSIDRTFGTNGQVVTPIGSGDDSGNSVTLQKDGKILVGGQSYSATGDRVHFALARYNVDGSLDTTFGTGGKVVTVVSPNMNVYDLINDIVVQADGKIVVTGTHPDIVGSIVLARYNADGSLDRSFGATRFTEGGKAVVIDQGITVYDFDLVVGGYNGASLLLTRAGGAKADDVFGIAGAQSLLKEGTALIVDGATIGTVNVNSGGRLLVSFNANASQTLIERALHKITYRNTSDAPPSSVSLSWTFSDGNGGAQGTGGPLSGTTRTTVHITGVNDAPEITSGKGAAAASYTVAENGTVVPALKAEDVDSGKLTWSIAGGKDAKLFSIDAKTGVLSFDTAPDFEAPTDSGRNNVYDVIVKVSDGRATDTQALGIKIGDVKGVTRSGTSGPDTFVGTAEADTFRGRDGNDTLKGMGGDDTLYGGAGADKLLGGEGRDVFVFDTAPGSGNLDRVQDFSAREDTIAFENAVFKALTKTGALSSAAFKDITNGAKLDADDRVLYNHDTGVLSYDADGDGATKAVTVAVIDKHPTLTFQDFQVV